MPASATVGTSGSAGSRLSPVTASALIWPPRMPDSTFGSNWKPSCVSPAIRSVDIWLAARYGTCTICTPVTCSKLTPPRCCELPLPTEP